MRACLACDLAEGREDLPGGRIHETLPGERRFYTEDPWGNRIELLAATEVPS